MSDETEVGRAKAQIIALAEALKSSNDREVKAAAGVLYAVAAGLAAGTGGTFRLLAYLKPFIYRELDSVTFRNN